MNGQTESCTVTCSPTPPPGILRLQAVNRELALKSLDMARSIHATLYSAPKEEKELPREEGNCLAADMALLSGILDNTCYVLNLILEKLNM